MPYFDKAAAMVNNGYFTDLNTIDNLDLTKNYWDNNFNSSVSLNNKLFFTVGDMIVSANDTDGDGKITENDTVGFLWAGNNCVSPRQVRRLYRDVTADFGLLPMLKLDESDDNYTTTVWKSFEALTVPITNSKLAETGFVLEALAEAGDKVSYAYYNICLESKYTRDE